MTRSRRSLKSKSVLFGITGSVAAYKAIDVIKPLIHEGASVNAIMTDASRRFITPLSVSLATGSPVYEDMFATPLAHVDLARQAHIAVVAPATANVIAKLAHGIADDMLSTTLLAFDGPLLIAPAMNHRMYRHPAVQDNLALLKSRGAVEIEPEFGALACGEEGKGRMAAPERIVEAIRTLLTPQDLAGKQVVITSGPTREPIDAVRFISNRSSGRMGHALALIARRRGARVTLISGPVQLPPPEGVAVITVETAAQMHAAVMQNLRGCHMLIMCAAVGDFRPESSADTKLSKDAVSTLALTQNADILQAVGQSAERPALVIGFAAEAGGNIQRAREKRVRKNADFIIYNDIEEPGAGFDTPTNRVTIIGPQTEQSLPLMDKQDVAEAVFDAIMHTEGRSATES